MTWRQYWETLRDHHHLFRHEAEHFVANLKEAVGLSPHWKVLDFGCGFGYVALSLAPSVAEVFLWDQAHNMREQAGRNLGGRGNVVHLLSVDESRFPGEHRFDLILVNSVVQYMDPDTLGYWLRRWSRMLAARGRLLISDLLPHDPRPWRELLSLLSFSWRRGTLLPALRKGLGEWRRYSAARRAQPLLQHTNGRLEELAAGTGLKMRLLEKNLGFQKQRMAALFTADGS